MNQWLTWYFGYLRRRWISFTHAGPIVYENSGGVHVDTEDQPSVRQTPAVKQR